MLYDLTTNQPISIPEWAEEEMMQDFPDFFNGRPLRLAVDSSFMRKVMKVPSHDYNQEPRAFYEMPGDYSIKTGAVIFDKETGKQLHLMYSESAINPSKQSPRIALRHGMTIMPYQEDLLFYLQYMCPMMQENQAYKKSPRAMFKFDRPEIAAAEKISDAKKARELENLVYFDIPYDVVLKAVEGLAMNKLETEEQNRVALHDAIKNGSETFRRNAFEIIGSYAKKETKKEEAPKENLESVHELINHLVEQKSIKNDSGKWYIRDRRGDGDKYLKTSFFESDSPEGVFALIDHLKVNKELLDKLRKL